MLESTFKDMDFSHHKKRAIMRFTSSLSNKKQSFFNRIFFLKPLLSIMTCLLFLGVSSFIIQEELNNQQTDSSPRLVDVIYELPLLYEKYSSDIGLQKAHKMGLTNEYKKTVVSSNVSINFTRAYYDGVNITISYNIINNSKVKWPDQPPRMIGASDSLMLKGNHEFKINGSQFSGGMRDRYINVAPNKYEGLLEVNPSHLPKGDSFIFEGHVSEIHGVKGDWNFKIPISKEKTKDFVNTFTPNVKVKGPRGETIVVNKIDFTPTAIGLETNTVTKGLDEEQFGKRDQYYFSIEAVGGDNGVSGYTERPQKNTFFTVTRSTFPPLKEIPKTLTVRAYNPSKLSENVVFEVPLVVEKEEQKGFFSKAIVSIRTFVEAIGNVFKKLF
jgi:hypothetical protein